MIDVQEHIYHDDPKIGHPDVRTYLRDVAYYFLGNGLIQAAVQSAPSGEGTPLGLLIQDAEKLGKKREALTQDEERGLEPTQITIEYGGRTYLPQTPKVEWGRGTEIPEVVAEWDAGPLRIRELFSCPRSTEPLLFRRVAVTNASRETTSFSYRTGAGGEAVGEAVALPPDGTIERILAYRLKEKRTSVSVEVLPEPPAPEAALTVWNRATRLHFDDALMDHLFQTCARQLPAVISKSGKVDASIWQYNREWVRDHSFMAEGLILTGHHDQAGVHLRRLLADFVSDDGDCLDSSERRAPEDVELDQNGALLRAVEEYALWSGDREIVSECWGKISKTAEFPLRPEFHHAPSGLLANAREYWERHAAFGIEPGFELMYQIYPSVGLAAASRMAAWIGKTKEADRWLRESARLKDAVMNHPKYRMVDARGFIKRRRLDGSVQETIEPKPNSGLPAGVPLAGSLIHVLRPDTSSVMPILLDFIPADDPVAKATLAGMETLWNQDWSIGGYGRYHYASEPDCSGPWPLASLLVARACLEAGDPERACRVLRWLNGLPSGRSGAWFELHGDRISPPYAQIGIIPWAWAEMSMLFVRHILGLRAGENGFEFRPRLLPRMGGVSGSLPFRGRRLNLDIRRSSGGAGTSVRIDGRNIEARVGIWPIPFADRDLYLEAIIPEP